MEKREKRARMGGAMLAAGAVVFFAFEFISSLGWNGAAPYSYLGNFISELGIPVVLEKIDSPLHALMNAGFVIYGIAVVFGCFFARRVLPKGKLAGIATGLIIASGIGVVFVGFFPGHDWELNFVHTIGAMLVIYAGNFGDILLCVGMTKERRFRYAPFGIALGIAGIVFSIVMATHYTSDYAGLYERIAIYPTIVFNFALGLFLLKSNKHAELR